MSRDGVWGRRKAKWVVGACWSLRGTVGSVVKLMRRRAKGLGADDVRRCRFERWNGRQALKLVIDVR